MTEFVVRARRPEDLVDCVAALRAVHDSDAYPLNWPADPRGWLTPPRLLQAWVAATPDGTLAGHVALQQAESVEVSRLFVAPAARRSSVATMLLRRAIKWAADHDQQLTLCVTDEHRSGAVAFYESTGWLHTHTTVADWTAPGGEPVRLRHYRPNS